MNQETKNNAECPECKGTGRIKAENCSLCEGTGRIIIHSHSHQHDDTVHDHPHPHDQPHHPEDRTGHIHRHQWPDKN